MTFHTAPRYVAAGIVIGLVIYGLNWMGVI